MEVFTIAKTLGLGPTVLILTLMFALACAMCIIFTAYTLWHSRNERKELDSAIQKSIAQLDETTESLERDIDKKIGDMDKEINNSLVKIRENVHNFITQTQILTMGLEKDIKSLNRDMDEMKKDFKRITHLASDSYAMGEIAMFKLGLKKKIRRGQIEDSDLEDEDMND